MVGVTRGRLFDDLTVGCLGDGFLWWMLLWGKHYVNIGLVTRRLGFAALQKTKGSADTAIGFRGDGFLRRMPLREFIAVGRLSLRFPP